MAIMPLEEFAEAVPSGTTIAGLDLGTKTIGLAVSDRGQRLTPRKVLRGRSSPPTPTRWWPH